MFFKGEAGARGHDKREAYITRQPLPGQELRGAAESFEAFAHLKKAENAVQGGSLSIFQPSGTQVLPSVQAQASAPLHMPMGAHAITEYSYYDDIDRLPPTLLDHH